MSTKDLSAPFRRAIGYGVVVTLALASGIFVFNNVVDRVIDEVEVVVQPCQHGGVWEPAFEKCSCIGPWAGPYCGKCTCENGGVCDQLNINVPFSGTLWGCRCPDNWLGSLCDLCTSNITSDGRCAGECLEGYSGSRCEKTCVEDADFEEMLLNELGLYDKAVDLWTAGGDVSACSGHGTCNPETNNCDCDLPTWFPSADGRSDCARTCVADDEGELCYGHGACTNTNNIVGCVCEYGWHLKSDCSTACPGNDIAWINEACSGKGTCSLQGDNAVCSCLDLHLGYACQYKCPTNEDGDSSVACNGHGICSVDDSPPYTKAVCDCSTGWVGKSCQCNNAQTCSGHGVCAIDGTCLCDQHWTGQRCNACVPGRYGSQCQLKCNERKETTASTPVDDIGCNSRGVCAVKNFARADESVVCGCAGNFDAETHCRDCKEYYYPKIGESGLNTAEEDAEIACSAFANRATCNYAGEPDVGYSSPALDRPSCQCDQPFVNGNNFCETCLNTFYPDGGDMSDPSKCSKRCVDEPEEQTWYPGVFTLICKNQGTCDPTGKFCICPDGYSGNDCGIACGGETPCSGHGACVSNKLQQFMSAEVKNSVSGGTSYRCECDPQPALDDNEKLKVFTGEEILGGDAVKSTVEYIGDFCEYSCLKPGWLDSITCNGEPCSILPIVDNQGSPIITDCQQDTDCGDWSSELGRLVFADANGDERTNLSPNELELRGQISLQNRWSPRMGPFCHVPTVPRSLHVANMKCIQRVNSDSVEEATEANCEAQDTRAKCLSQGGTCRWADVCQEALDDVDEFSYCFELMRTERPAALRSENCTASCDLEMLKELDWSEVCEHYESRTPAQFATCGSDLDDLCVANVDATATAQACIETLPLKYEMDASNFLCNVDVIPALLSKMLPYGEAPYTPELCQAKCDELANCKFFSYSRTSGHCITHEFCEDRKPSDTYDIFQRTAPLLPALAPTDVAAFCFETSLKNNAMFYPFKYDPILDTTKARDLQSKFVPQFLEIGNKHACVVTSYDVTSACSSIEEYNNANMLFDTPAPPLYLCEVDGTNELGGTDLSGQNVDCKIYNSVRDLNPFVLECLNSQEDLEGLSVLEAVDESLRRGCVLTPKSNLHASGVYVTEDEATSICRKVLEDENPDDCKRVCGDDVCSDVGTNSEGTRIFECERDDPLFVSPESCLLGVFSLTGADAGAVYRCAVAASDLANICSINFNKCQDTLALHVDQMGMNDPSEGNVQVTGIQGFQSILLEDSSWKLNVPSLKTIVRVEFDVLITSQSRGAVTLLSDDGGVIASILLHHFGGRSWNLNGQTEAEAQPCAAGEGDSCRTTVEVNRYYRVVLQLSNSHVRADFGTDAPLLKERVLGVSQKLDAITVSGSAQLKQVYAFAEVTSDGLCDYQTMCSNLYRKTGRSATWRESTALPSVKTTLDFCAAREESVSLYSGCKWGSVAEHDAAFSAPWHSFCDYHDYVVSLGDCSMHGSEPSRDKVLSCAPVLSKFDDVSCAQDALQFDWEEDYCVPLRNDTSPSLLQEIGCDSECLAEIERSDLQAFCDDRALYWNGKTAIPRVPEGCVNDDQAKTRWQAVDWSQFCKEKASNTAKGVCSAASCDCSLNGGFLGGDACELSCPIGTDGSACNEDSFSGVCDYRPGMREAVDEYYQDESKLIVNHRAGEILGKCRCANSNASPEDGCTVTCDTDDGEPLCNTRNTHVFEENWNISACHPGGTGVCACLPQLTRQVTEERTDWRGNKASVLTFEYGGLPYGSAWQDKFRLRASQGAKSLLINYFNYTESTWKVARQKFELEPGLFMCGDEPCDFSDVVLAQNLYATSPFYGPTCSRRCPSVDTGESLNLLPHDCVADSSNLIGADRLTLEACKNECLDKFKCNFIRYNAKTSDCRMFEKCARKPDICNEQPLGPNDVYYGTSHGLRGCAGAVSNGGNPEYVYCTATEAAWLGAGVWDNYISGIHNEYYPTCCDWVNSQCVDKDYEAEFGQEYGVDIYNNPCPSTHPYLRKFGDTYYYCYASTEGSDNNCRLSNSDLRPPPGGEWGTSGDGDCVLSSNATDNVIFWYERELTHEPQLQTCSNRGRCTPTGSCVCDSAKYLSLTDPITGVRIRTGANEVGSLQNIPVTSLDTTGFRGDDCSKVCPGFDPIKSDMSDTCSGHGICSRAATCQCAIGYTGQNCELPCPRLLNDGETKTTCSGHGTCFEARINLVESSIEKEDVLQQYQLSEAWRQWYNECPDNQDLSYLILPFNSYSGMLNQTEIKGGVDCESVPQVEEDDVSKPYIQRPEIKMKALRDFIELDSERDLDDETAFNVDGVSVDTTHKREGVFRRRYWYEADGTERQQTVFATNFSLVQIEDDTQYEQFPGFSCCDPDSTCDSLTIGQRLTGVLTAGACAALCEADSECSCFDYQEFYHSAFLGGCRLTKVGSLFAYPVHKAIQVGLENGLMTKDVDGEPIPFDEFEGTYVKIQEFKSCRAPTKVLSENALSAAACAKLCADRFDEGCVYFTYQSSVLRCSQVKTESSECPEGFSTDPSGFYAVAMVDQGSTAPTSYDSVGSARIFPKDKNRGTLSGLYYGRARPNWVIAVAQCSCSKSYSFGHWAGFACQSCDQYWGGSACTRKCPGMIGGEPCWGNGKCLWGSKDGLGEPGTFYDAICLCGDPPAPKASDLTLTGTWQVDEFDLHVETSFVKINAITEFFENPNNYGFADTQCRACIEQRGGKNCASQCSYCLFGGFCQFSIADSISVPCLCTSQYYDTQNGCSPHGFILDELAIRTAVGQLSAKNRAKRLKNQPGLEVDIGTFYDDAVFPLVETSLFPSRKFTMPCPNTNERSWMQDVSTLKSRPCKRMGTCRNVGVRKVVSQGIPPRYFPLSCSELGGAWENAYRDLWFLYEEKFFLNATDLEGSEGFYAGNGTYASFDRSDDIFKDTTLDNFTETCRRACIDIGTCNGIVLKREYFTTNAWCYLTRNTYISSPAQEFMLEEPNSYFIAYQLEKEYDFCRNNEPYSYTVKVKEKAYCSAATGDRWLQQNGVDVYFPPRLSPGDSLYDEDPAEECRKRCQAAFPDTQFYGVYIKTADGTCGMCRTQCETTTPSDDFDSYSIVYEDQRWCSLGAVTYGEIDLCADMPLELIGEDSTTDSTLDQQDITMGNLGRRCQFNTGTEEDPVWEKGVGTQCDDSSAKLDDASSIMNDYVPSADALVFGAYKENEFAASVSKVPKTLGTMRPENPCNAKAGFFWDPDNRMQCRNSALRESCTLQDWEQCEKEPPVEASGILTVPCLDTDVVVAEKTYRFIDTVECSGAEVMMYAGATELTDGISDNPGDTYDERVYECHKACVLRQTPHADTQYQWTHSDMKIVFGFIVEPNGRCFCEGQKSEQCNIVTSYHRYDIVNCANLHSVHSTRAISPHKLMIDGLDLETTVTVAAFKFNIRDTNIDELQSKLATKQSTRNTKSNRYNYVKNTLLPARTSIRNSKWNTYKSKKAARKKAEDDYPTCGYTSEQVTKWCCFVVCWDCGSYTVKTYSCSEKQQVKDAKKAQTVAWKDFLKYNNNVNSLTKERSALEKQISRLDSEIASLQLQVANAANNICSTTSLCDLCQGTCSNNDECRSGLICATAANAVAYDVCGLTPATAINLGSLNGDNEKFCMPYSTAVTDGVGNTKNMFLAAFFPEENLLASAIVIADATTYKVTSVIAMSLNQLEDDDISPFISTKLRQYRADSLVEPEDGIMPSVMGYIVNYGTAGTIPRPGQGQRMIAQKRGFVTGVLSNAPKSCHQLCAETPGCTFSSYQSIHREINSYHRGSYEDYNNCEKYDCGPCEGDVDGTESGPNSCADTVRKSPMRGGGYQTQTLKLVERSSPAFLHGSKSYPQVCINKENFDSGSNDYCFPDVDIKEDYKCMLFTDTVKPPDTYQLVATSKYCKSGDFRLGHTTNREGKGPMLGDEELYYLLGDPTDHLQECANRCRYAHPTYNGFYIDSGNGCFCAPSCLEDDLVASTSTWKSYKIVRKSENDVTCDDVRFPGNIGSYSMMAIKKPNACNLCKEMGMAYSFNNFGWILDSKTNQYSYLTDALNQVFCKPYGYEAYADDAKICSVLPEVNETSKNYVWRSDRCAPARGGFNKMRTSIVRVGEQFKLTEASPYITIAGHPDIEAYAQCESMCAEDQKCQAWHFSDFLSPERGDDVVTHLCELFEYVPPMESTADNRENLFSGRTRIGTIQRDFSPINVYMDDGDHAACDCDEDEDGEGYDCGCQANSGVPYSSEASDDVWGCSGYGQCGGLGYFCVCEDGYHWAWGEADIANGVPAGFTCRPCDTGTYKNSDVKQCTACPIGKYQDQTASASCKVCPEDLPATQYAGNKDQSACQTCPQGRVNSKLSDPDHEDFMNLNYDTSTQLCRLCEIGKIDTEFGYSADNYAVGASRSCQTCKLGKTTSKPGSSVCDVVLYDGTCNEGKGWQEPDPNILGGVPCLECKAGMWNGDDPEDEYCKFCGVNKNTNEVGSDEVTDCKCDRGFEAKISSDNGAITLLRSTQAKPDICNNPGLPPNNHAQPGVFGCAGAKYSNGVTWSLDYCKNYSEFYSTCCVWKNNMCQDRGFLSGSLNRSIDINTCEDASAGTSPNSDSACKAAMQRYTLAKVDLNSAVKSSAVSSGVTFDLFPVSNCFDRNENTHCSTDGSTPGGEWVEVSLAPNIYTLRHLTIYVALSSTPFGSFHLTAYLKNGNQINIGPYQSSNTGATHYSININSGIIEIDKVRIVALTQGNQISVNEIWLHEHKPIEFDILTPGSNDVPPGCTLKFNADDSVEKAYYNYKADSTAKCGHYTASGESFACICSSNDACEECAPGTYSPTVDSQCTYCANAHTYTDQYAQTTCKLCPIGTDKNNPDFSTSCLACRPGKYNNEEGKACKFCPDKYYSVAVGLTASDQCTRCPFGYESVPNRQSCQACPSGYADYNSVNVCRLCFSLTENLYQDEAAQAECKSCPLGYSVKNEECEICPSGWAPKATTEDDLTCSLCIKAEHFSDEPGLSECKLCPAGWGGIRGIMGTYFCQECPYGRYNSEVGAETYAFNEIGILESPSDYGLSGDPTCKICPTGSIPNTDRAGCMTCNTGRYTDEVGATYLDCKACVVGKTQMKSFEADDIATECHDCPVGYYGYLEDTDAESSLGIRGLCVSCPSGEYQDEEGQTSCKTCPLGTTHTKSQSVLTVIYETASATYASDCEGCPAGKSAPTFAFGFIDGDLQNTENLKCGTTAEVMPELCYTPIGGINGYLSGCDGARNAKSAEGYYGAHSNTYCSGGHANATAHNEWYSTCCEMTSNGICRDKPFIRLKAETQHEKPEMCKAQIEYGGRRGCDSARFTQGVQEGEFTQNYCIGTATWDMGSSMGYDRRLWYATCCDWTEEDTCVDRHFPKKEFFDDFQNRFDSGLVKKEEFNIREECSTLCGLNGFIRMDWFADSSGTQSGTACNCCAGDPTTSVAENRSHLYEVFKYNGECVECFNGAYQDQAQQMMCKACPVGQVRVAGVDDPTYCTGCMSSRYITLAGKSDSWCEQCPDGYFQPLDYPDSTPTSTCQACPAGYLGSSTSDSNFCLVCQIGQYGDEEGIAIDYSSLYSCKDCPAGYSQLPLGQAQTIVDNNLNDLRFLDQNAKTYELLEANTYCFSYSRPPGPYSDGYAEFLDPSDPMASSDKAEECAKRCLAEGRNYFFLHKDFGGRCMCGDDGCANELQRVEFLSTDTYVIRPDILAITQCTACAAGLYENEEGGIVCTECGTGKYTKELASTECKFCPAGFTADFFYEEGIECATCSNGEEVKADVYNAHGVTGASWMDCVNCPVGKFQKHRYISFSRFTGSIHWLLNPLEVYSPNCELCPYGKYNDETGEQNCFDCSPGSSTTILGATTSLDCEDCPAGFYGMANGMPGCQSCHTGRFMETATFAPYSSLIPSWFDQDNDYCKACPSGYYSDHDSTGQRRKFSETGAMFDWETYWNVYAIKDDGSTSCAACPSGYESAVTLHGEHTVEIDWSDSYDSCTIICPSGKTNQPTWTHQQPDLYGEAVGDAFGSSVAVNYDGTVIAGGASEAHSDSTYDTGHVRVYVKQAKGWLQRGSDIDGPYSNNRFAGYHQKLDINDDGTVIAMASSASSTPVRLFEWDGLQWIQIFTVSNNTGEDTIALDGTGQILITGFEGFDSDGLTNNGRARVWRRDEYYIWSQMGSDIKGTATGDYLGNSVAINRDGTRIAVGSKHSGKWANSGGNVLVYDWLNLWNFGLIEENSLCAGSSVPAATYDQFVNEYPTTSYYLQETEKTYKDLLAPTTGPQYNPCPASHPRLVGPIYGNQYWCRAPLPSTAACRMSNSTFPPPAGGEWGTNQDDCTFNYCPFSHPHLELDTNWNSYWCYSQPNLGGSVCTMKNSGYAPPPGGGGWGSSQADCNLDPCPTTHPYLRKLGNYYYCWTSASGNTGACKMNNAGFPNRPDGDWGYVDTVHETVPACVIEREFAPPIEEPIPETPKPEDSMYTEDQVLQCARRCQEDGKSYFTTTEIRGKTWCGCSEENTLVSKYEYNAYVGTNFNYKDRAKNHMTSFEPTLTSFEPTPYEDPKLECANWCRSKNRFGATTFSIFKQDGLNYCLCGSEDCSNRYSSPYFDSYRVTDQQEDWYQLPMWHGPKYWDINKYEPNASDVYGSYVEMNDAGTVVVTAGTVQSTIKILVFTEVILGLWMTQTIDLTGQNDEKCGTSISVNGQGNRITVGCSHYDATQDGEVLNEYGRVRTFVKEDMTDFGSEYKESTPVNNHEGLYEYNYLGKELSMSGDGKTLVAGSHGADICDNKIKAFQDVYFNGNLGYVGCAGARQSNGNFDNSTCTNNNGGYNAGDWALYQRQHAQWYTTCCSWSGSACVEKWSISNAPKNHGVVRTYTLEDNCA